MTTSESANTWPIHSVARDAVSSTPHKLLKILSNRIRVATKCQVARFWYDEASIESETTTRRLSALERAGVIRAYLVRARELQLEHPIWSWAPGDPTPPFGRLSYQLRSRWIEPLRPTTVYVASSKSARRYAGTGGRLAHPLQVTHDLHVAAIFFRLLRENPEEAEGWVSEDLLAASRRGGKLPDAEIHDDSGRPLKVIEFGGSYGPERVRKIHDDCVRRQLPYELW